MHMCKYKQPRKLLKVWSTVEKYGKNYWQNFGLATLKIDG